MGALVRSSYGARLVIVPNDARKRLTVLDHRLTQATVLTLQAPTVFSGDLGEEPLMPRRRVALHQIMLCGEAFGSPIAIRATSWHTSSLLNHYGPTE